MIRAIIVDDHPLMSEGLVRLAGEELGWLVAGTATSRRGAIELVRRERPDVMVLDLQLPDGHGLDLLRDVLAEHPALRVAVVTASQDPAYSQRARAAGAHSFVRKDESRGQLLAALRAALTPAVAARAAQQSESPVDRLSERELSVLQLIGQGRATREIAAVLGISFKTVEAHRENIKRKLGLANAVALAQFAALWVNRPA